MKPTTRISPSYKYLFASYRAGARRRKFDFQLDIQQFVEIISRPCTYCNRPPRDFNIYLKNNGTRKSSHLSTTQRGVDKAWIKANGIDRIENNIGYTLDNSISCCSVCNMMKHSMNVVHFIAHIEQIHKHFIQGKE